MANNRRAVAIAKDVLKQLAVKKITAVTGTYFTGLIYTPYKQSDDFKQHVGAVCNCKVCALGACLISKVKLYNAVPMREVMSTANSSVVTASRGKIERLLDNIFTKEQLDLIECAFEGWYIPSYSNDGDAENKRAASAFGKRYKTDKGRLAGIMRNIIANKGTFRPEIARKRSTTVK